MVENKAFTYDAFISYRHRPLDIAVAKAIHKQLETYRIPAYIKKKTGKKKMGKLFRDQDELPLLADLGEGIRIALRQSEWLIVICSPDLPLSKWCLAEIDYFIELGRQDHILTVLVAGEPDESFPAQLRYINGDEREPLAADVRAKNAGQTLRKAKSEKLRLLAPMLGVGYDDLRRRQRERRVKSALAIGSVALATMIFATSYVLRQNQILAKQVVLTEEQRQIAVNNEEWAKQERNTALISQSKFLSGLSMEQMSMGDPVRASLLALEALPKSPDDPERPLVPEAEAALRIANLSDRQAGYSLISAISATYTTRFDYLEALDLFMLVKPEAIEFYNGKNGLLVGCVEVAGQQVYAYSEHTARFAKVVTGEDGSFLRIYSLPGLESRDYPLHDKGYYTLTFFPDGRQLMVSRTGSTDDYLSVYDTDTGELLWMKTAKELYEGVEISRENVTSGVNISGFSISPDGKYIAYGASGAYMTTEAFLPVRVMETETQQTVAELGTPLDRYVPYYTSDSEQLMLHRYDNGAIESWNIQSAAKQFELGADYEHSIGFSRGVLFSPDGQYMAVHTYDDKAIIYHTYTGEIAAEPTQDWTFAQIGFTDDHTLVFRDSVITSALMTFPVDGTAVQGIVISGGLYEAAMPLANYTIYTDVFYASSKTLVTYSTNGLYQIWQRDAGYGYLPTDDAAYSTKVFSNDGTKAMLSDEAAVYLFDTQSGEKLLKLDAVRCVAAKWSPDDAQLLIGGHDGTVQLWDTRTGKLISEIPSEYTSSPFSVRLSPSPDWKHLIINSPAHTDGLYSLPSLTKITDFEHLIPKAEPWLVVLGLISNAAFLPDGQHFLIPFNGKLVTIDTATQKITATYDYECDNDVSISPDGKRLAFFNRTGRDEFDIVVINPETGELIWRQAAHSSVYGKPIVWSADSKLIATSEGSRAETKVWNAESGVLLQTFAIDDPSFSRDGSLISGEVVRTGISYVQYLGLGSGEIYDIESGRLYMQLPRAGVFNIVNNAVLMSCGIWTPQSLADDMNTAAKRLEQRELTEAERQMFYLY